MKPEDRKTIVWLFFLLLLLGAGIYIYYLWGHSYSWWLRRAPAILSVLASPGIFIVLVMNFPLPQRIPRHIKYYLRVGLMTALLFLFVGLARFVEKKREERVDTIMRNGSLLPAIGVIVDTYEYPIFTGKYARRTFTAHIPIVQYYVKGESYKQIPWEGGAITNPEFVKIRYSPEHPDMIEADQ